MGFAYQPVNQLTLTRFVFECRFCNGEGTTPQHFVDKFLRPLPCPLCCGSGNVTVDLIGDQPFSDVCSVCNGDGHRVTLNLNYVPCQACGGLGQVPHVGCFKIVGCGC